MYKEIPFIGFYYHSKNIAKLGFIQKSKWLLNSQVHIQFCTEYHIFF